MEMAKYLVKRLLSNSHFTQTLIRREESYRRLIYSFVNRFQPRRSKADKVDSDALKQSKVAALQASVKDGIGSYSSEDDDLGLVKEKKRLELSWLPKALEPALQLCRWALTGPTGCYKNNEAALARNCMLWESNVVKFDKYSSVMRPGYYIGIDTRSKLVIPAIHGTHTVYDLIADVVSSSDGEVTREGFSTHFGTAEAAHWFLTHEMGNIRKYLEKYEGFKLRLVGHSLGGATAALLAIMLREKSYEELGFSPEIVSAVGYATPPCVSKELVESCTSYVSTVVMQDDIIPRLSVASLRRLRNEILQTDCVVEKEDWRSVIDLVTNAKQVVSSVQDVVAKLADYAKFKSNKDSPDDPMINSSPAASRVPSNDKVVRDNTVGSSIGDCQ